MIKVIISKKNNEVKRITITGHANFDSHGKDIVCASVSTMAITSINAILSIDNNAINYEESEGLLVIVNKNNDHITNNILTNLINMLNELATDYPKNISIREE